MRWLPLSAEVPALPEALELAGGAPVDARPDEVDELALLPGIA
ncbi:MAG TPA: hypothetical protein VMA32_04960 [Streptosporangiaceae bacterium]|nr:hypothetical protein [Streptosporangiaceae bacterium]